MLVGNYWSKMYLKLREDCLELFYTCLSEGTIFNTMSLKELFAEAQFEIEGDEENMKKKTPAGRKPLETEELIGEVTEVVLKDKEGEIVGKHASKVSKSTATHTAVTIFILNMYS